MSIGETTANLIGYLGRATWHGREIWAPLELNGGIPVNIQDQTTQALDLDFHQPQGTPTTLTADAAVGDSNFGHLSELASGVVLRVNGDVINNIWDVKTNGDLGLLCFDAAYTTKAPSGSFGYRFRNTYAGQAKHGVVLRLLAGDVLEVLIQDNLSTLESFKMMAQGHVATH